MLVCLFVLVNLESRAAAVPTGYSTQFPFRHVGEVRAVYSVTLSARARARPFHEAPSAFLLASFPLTCLFMCVFVCLWTALFSFENSDMAAFTDRTRGDSVSILWLIFSLLKEEKKRTTEVVSLSLSLSAGDLSGPRVWH